jgi:glyoxylase-like metal-dependent hydrolase (beta-lactamase superfamily II)
VPETGRFWWTAVTARATPAGLWANWRQDAIIEAVEDFRDFRVCLPTMYFSKAMTLHTGLFRVELVHVGGVHAEDSVIVKIPEAGVMFLGDSYYPPVYFERTPENDHLDVAMLESFLEEGYSWYVDGHGKPRTMAQMQELINEERQRQGI